MKKLRFSKDRLAEAKDIRRRWYAGEKTERTPFTFTVNAAVHGAWMGGNKYNFTDVCNDSKKAVEANLLSIQHMFDTFPNCDMLPQMNLYYFGEGILASIYGAKQLIADYDPPYTEGRYFKTIYETEKLSNEIDFEKTFWGARLKEDVERFVDATGGQITVGPPDYQSPYGTATKLLPNEALMLAMYDEPELTHKFLNNVTDGIIKLNECMERWAGSDVYARNHSNPIPGECGIIIWDDYVSVINPSLHTEFCAPCNLRLYERFGRGHLHTCGPYFPGYVDACLACEPRSLDIAIMRGMSKTREDMAEFLSIANKKGVKLFGSLASSDAHIFENKWQQPDSETISAFLRGGWFPSGGGTAEEGKKFKEMIEDFDRQQA
ncbi:MAG: uroporphyrinogen decarboxylase family protein [Defluviitaleaceae bacterium]|nr:uroporphyrinogen decarboxylase family protein [Defluviitaleaceae bacterium]